MVLTLAMSLAVTSSIVWGCFRPLIAANIPRIMGIGSLVSAAGSGDFGDGRGVDAGLAGDGEGGRATGVGGHLLDDAGLADAVGAGVRDGAADQADRGRAGELRGDLLILGDQVRDLLDHGERRHLPRALVWVRG